MLTCLLLSSCVTLTITEDRLAFKNTRTIEKSDLDANAINIIILKGLTPWDLEQQCKDNEKWQSITMSEPWWALAINVPTLFIAHPRKTVIVCGEVGST